MMPAMQYSPYEIEGIRRITFKSATKAMTAKGWAKDDDLKAKSFLANHSAVELWVSKNRSASAWVIKDPEDADPTRISRVSELVLSFADEHHLSTFEAIALLSGQAPWASEEVKTEIIEVTI